MKRKGFNYVVSALFSRLQLEILRWAVIWIKEVRCLDRASSGVSALWEEQASQEVAESVAFKSERCGFKFWLRHELVL